jgi:hypothetical protein
MLYSYEVVTSGAIARNDAIRRIVRQRWLLIVVIVVV